MEENTKRMISGKIYDPYTKEIHDIQKRAHALCLEYNNLNDDGDDQIRRNEILKELLPNAGEGTYLQGGIYFDYGRFFHCGKFFYANQNFTVLDTSEIFIGDFVMCGPNVSIYTPLHPMVAEERAVYFSEKLNRYTDDEYSASVRIGSYTWICGDVTICSGVTIGERCVIGAGSVVTRDIPDDSFAAGNPCRVIRKITEKDSIKYKKEIL